MRVNRGLSEREAEVIDDTHLESRGLREDTRVDLRTGRSPNPGKSESTGSRNLWEQVLLSTQTRVQCVSQTINSARPIPSILSGSGFFMMK